MAVMSPSTAATMNTCAPILGSEGWGAGDVTGMTEADHARERHRRELKSIAARMTPRHAKTMLRDSRREQEHQRRHSDRKKQADRESQLWPGMIYESSRWIDRSKEEREDLRRRERARQGIG